MTKKVQRSAGGFVHSRRECRKAFAMLCRCLVVDRVKFFVCCGYYCAACGNRVPEESRRTGARVISA